MNENEKVEVVKAILEMNRLKWNEDPSFTKELMDCTDAKLAYFFFKNLQILKSQKQTKIRQNYVSNELFQYMLLLIKHTKRSDLEQEEMEQIRKELINMRRKDFIPTEDKNMPLFNPIKLYFNSPEELDDILALCLYFQIQQKPFKENDFVIQKIKQYFPFITDFRQSLIRMQVANWENKTLEEKRKAVMKCLDKNLSYPDLRKTRQK